MRHPSRPPVLGRGRLAALATLATLATLVIVAPAAPSPQAPAIKFAELLVSPAPGQREFVELWNAGSLGGSLQGWTVADAAGNAYVFGDVSIPAGGRLVLWVGGSSDALGPAWARTAVWNDDADTAILRNAAGATVDTVAYPTQVPAPPRGQSVALLNGTWSLGSPTPGLAPGAQGATAAATVNQVPPVLAISGPTRAATGAKVALTLDILEPNGEPVTWRVASGPAVVSEGSGVGRHPVNATAPARVGPWELVASARDGAGNTANATLSIDVRAGPLAIEPPPEGIAFPSFDPGARNVTSNVFRIEILDGPRAPRIDVSPFRLGASAIPVESNLWIGVRFAGEAPWQWVRYDGPLTPLPNMAAGAWEAVFRIDAVPSPLAAGAYGTSFAVVP